MRKLEKLRDPHPQKKSQQAMQRKEIITKEIPLSCGLNAKVDD